MTAGTKKEGVEMVLNILNMDPDRRKKAQVASLSASAPATPVIDKEIKIRDELEYIKTGVTGFDGLIDKGIPKGSQILISGGPGTSKTTFCLQTLAYAAMNGEKCLYLSFEEDSDKLLYYMRSFGWKPEDCIKKGTLMIRKMDPFIISRSIETLLARARGELLIETNEVNDLIPENYKPDRIVLDSLSAVSAGFFGKEEGYRAYISQVFELFRKIGATSFLISEIEQSTTKYSKSGVEEFLADAVFAFYNFRQGSSRISATEIIKIRGTSHKKRIVPFKVNQKGIEVYPLEEVFASEG
jgi:KaiC/GvpD/RAD55 family RecA-like ATPase